MPKKQLFDREVFFDAVRDDPFNGDLEQSQVDGMSAILDEWEKSHKGEDLRWLAYMFATTYHETAQEMQPIEEYGHGGNAEYAQKDPETGQEYYGRGFVQLTWRENYARADKELGLKGDRSCEWHAENALELDIASAIMFVGMIEGWFRTHDDGKPETLARYFNEDDDDAYQAREIINGDKHIIPSWSNGISIGNLIANYHDAFLIALSDAVSGEQPPRPRPTPEELVVQVVITAPPGVRVEVNIQEES